MLIKCINCKSGWEIAPEESFCGWCGSPTLNFKVSFEHEEPLLYADELENSTESIIISLRIENTGIKPINITLHKTEDI